MPKTLFSKIVGDAPFRYLVKTTLSSLKITCRLTQNNSKVIALVATPSQLSAMT
jgi:hypothetical protein